ncbi:MAG: hypothetical protein ACRD27_07220 [Terracidiphilus sp.]
MRQKFDAPAPLVLWHLASFDAPTVAVVWSLAFAWAAGVRLPIRAPLLLALAAWSVYIGDRLLDARSGLRAPDLHQLRERHFYHWRHRHALIPLAVAAALAALGIVLAFMPLRARTPDSLLAAAALAYFSGVHSRRKLPRLVTKEFLVGAIFTAGCALPAWLCMRGRCAQSWPLFVPAIYFAALAWLNCHSIARWESGSEHPRGTGVQPLGAALALAGFFLAAAVFAAHPRTAALLAAGALSALLLALLDRMQGRLVPLALRALADLVLLTPLFLLPANFELLKRFLA